MGKYISSDPDILGGAPVVIGTRVPLSRILFLLKDGYTLEAIAKEYPHISLQILSGAIDEVIDTLNTSRYAEKV